MGETTIPLLSVRSRKVIGENSELDITDFPFVRDYWNSRNGFVPVLHPAPCPGLFQRHRTEEHTSELQSLMSQPYAVCCLPIKKHVRLRIEADNLQRLHFYMR